MSVYIPQQPLPTRTGWMPDLSPATKYGELKFVFGGGEVVYTNPAKAIKIARQKLKDFNPDRDFICWPSSGDPASIYITVQVLSAMGYHKLTYLCWNRRRDKNGNVIKASGYYCPIEINAGEENHGNY